MALKSTIFKISLQVNDFNRDHYQLYPLKVALHPSETEARMLMRVLAFALHADERLSFTRGLSSDDEPDLWQKSLSDEIELWLELGQPDVKRLRKASSRSRSVVIYTYGGKGVDQWYDSIQNDLSKLDNVKIIRFDLEAIKTLVSSLQRSTDIDCMIQDNVLSVVMGQCSQDVKFISMLSG